MNVKINGIHACMALANLESLNDFVNHNKYIYLIYKNRLKELDGIKLLEFDETIKTSYKNIILEVNENWCFSRDETVYILNKNNILARKYYSPALHQKKMNYPHNHTKLQTTDILSNKYILMPSGFQIRDYEIHKLCDFLIKLSKNKIT